MYDLDDEEDSVPEEDWYEMINWTEDSFIIFGFDNHGKLPCKIYLGDLC